jgi:ABC-2 type transport system ATP-binding protein
MSVVLEAVGVTKTYRSGGSAVEALRGLSLSVPRGVVYGLLGPNGAGKSTFLRIVLGLVRANDGHCRLLGESTAGPHILRRVGALIESPALYPFLTATETLQALAKTTGFDEPGRIGELLERTGLAHAADRRVRSFSLGMKQRLGVAAALLARPELLILDEPVNGLDPAGILEMRTLMRDLVKQEGATVILSSHLMEEVQKTCDRVAILNLGALVAEGNVADLLAARGALLLRATPVETALGVLGSQARRQGESIAVDVNAEDAPAVIRRLVEAGVDIYEARWSSASLEDVFLSLTRSA